MRKYHYCTEAKTTMSDKNLYMAWLDMEMTGLNPDPLSEAESAAGSARLPDRILQVACVITDAQLNVIATAPEFVVHQSAAQLDAMDNWNKGTHGGSGLIDKVNASVFTESDVENALLQFLTPVIPRGKIPLCGNSIHQDRRFMRRYMPRLDDYFHYRTVDVSTLKELAARWRPDVKDSFQKQQKHTALEDVLESIAELKHYAQGFLRLN